MLSIIILFSIMINVILCGLFDNIIKSSTKKVIGGYVVKPKNKYIFMVSIQYRKKHSCGGSLIKYNKVITAAHCNFGDIEDFKVVWHRHNLLLDNKDEDGISFDIINRMDHPEFIEAALGNDVSIWTLNTSNNPNFKSYYESYNINLILEDNSLYNLIDLKLKAIGWGRTMDTDKNSSLLLEIELPILNFTQCYNNYLSLTKLKLNHTSQFCAGYFDDRGKDTCAGDSGGPLFYQRDDTFYFVGIVSYGVACAMPSLPGVYTNIYGLRDFILLALNS